MSTEELAVAEQQGNTTMDKQQDAGPVTQAELEKLAAKAKSIGGKIQEFYKKEFEFNKACGEFDELEQKFVGQKQTFSSFFKTNLPHILKLRSEFPGIKNPGSKERLALWGKQYLWSEFVVGEMGITLEYLNRLIAEHAPEVKANPSGKGGGGRKPAADRSEAAKKANETRKAQAQEPKQEAVTVDFKVDDSHVPKVDEHTNAAGLLAYFKRCGGLKSQVHDFEMKVLKPQGFLSKVQISYDEE